MAKTMSDKGVAALRPRAERYAKADPELRGMWVRIQPSGAKSFWTVARNPDGKQIWTHVALCDAMTIEAAREKARTILQRVRAGLPAIEPKGETLGSVLDAWLKRHVEGNELRSRDKIVDLIGRHIPDDLRAREFIGIRRSDIVALLDHIEDAHGGPQADLVLGIFRRAMNWYASRHDSYLVPLVRGMQRSKQRGRERILSDDEIRWVWAVAAKSGTYGALIRLLLLTGQRLDKILTWKWTDISPMRGAAAQVLYTSMREMTGRNTPPTWTVRTELREKGNIGAVELPTAVLAILDALPRFSGNNYILAGRGNSHIAYSGNPKRVFDSKLPAEMERWTLHDLRRTARSLLSRAGVPPHVAEKVMGHSAGAIEQIYDRHRYFDEKSEALAKLANLIDAIVGNNVKPMTRAGKR